VLRILALVLGRGYAVVARVARTFPYLVIAVLIFALGSGAARAVPPIDVFRLADATDTSRMAAVDASGRVAVSVASLPARTLASDGKFFSVTKLADADPVLTIPAGLVLTDARVSFSVPENVPDAAALFIADAGHVYVYQIVNRTTYEATLHLESGIMSDGSLRVELSCYNIAGNHCQGAIMWSGYRP
jgi:hypothetical protein